MPRRTAALYDKAHLHCIKAISAQMSDCYKELFKSDSDEAGIRSFPVDGDQVSVTLCIPDTLRDAAKEEAAPGA